MKDAFWLNDESKLSFDVFKSRHSRTPIFNTHACRIIICKRFNILTQIMNAFQDDTLQHLLNVKTLAFVQETVTNKISTRISSDHT